LSFIFISQVHPQTLSRSELDSLYIKFLQARAPELLLPTEKILDLTLEEKKCGFGLVSQVKMNLELFTPDQQKVLKSLLIRPLLQTFVDSPSGFFRIHYDETGSNRPAYNTGLSVVQNVAEVANALDSVYRFEIEYLGFIFPPSDNGAGGDDKYDVYIQNQGGSVYGYTEWESKVGSINWTSFMVIDNDYVGYYSTGLNGMRVTVAHEFHHGIQLGNYSVLNSNSPFRDSDLFFYELTSTSMEEFVYDDVNDYYAYMGSYFNNPDAGFPDQNGYNLAIWNIYIKDNYGYGIIKRQWELIPNTKAILVINQTLNEIDKSFPRELNRFGIWTYFTNQRAIQGQYFEEAQFYPLISPMVIRNVPPYSSIQVDANPTSNNFIRFNITTNSDLLFAIITNGDVNSASQFQNPEVIFEYRLYNDGTSGSRKLTNDYSSDFIVSNTNWWSASEILNDIVVREDTAVIPIVEENNSFIFPNPFSFSENIYSNISIVTDAPNGTELNFSVFSSGMELVYSEAKQVGALKNNSLGINWDGLDNSGNKLASGVYIYVIKNGDEVVKGKVVIFNE